MDDDAELDALNQLWSNFCITYTYEPGSTVKPFPVACGLDTGTLDPNRTFICDGYETISGHDIHCVNTNGHGLETVEDALKNSCNDALMQMSYDIGPENFSKYQQIFGFGTKTNIDLPGEARTDSLIYTEDQLSTINPVSYTHLDVYKRQNHDRVSSLMHKFYASGIFYFIGKCFPVKQKTLREDVHCGV